MGIGDRRALLNVIPAALLCWGVLGCSTAISGSAVAEPARLEFRPVLSVAPAATQANSAPPRPQDVAAARATRQSADAAAQQQALAELSCAGPDVLAGSDDPMLPLVTCAADGNEKYILAPSFLGGEAVKDAVSRPTPYGDYAVDLTFTASGQQQWAEYTRSNVGEQVAFVLDSRVVSAPRINSEISGGTTTIQGRLSEQRARDLATALKGK